MSQLSAGDSAIVRTPVAPLHGEARVSSPQTSQLLAGHDVEVLAAEGDWLRVRGEDEYEGWMHRGYLAAVPPATARRSRGLARVSLGCVTRTAAGSRRALPLGARLAPEEIVQSGEALDPSELAGRFPADPLAITRSAQTFFEGTSYLWGGVTPWGADCSGLVQSIFRLHGIPLPRDAWQQALSGGPGAEDPRTAAPADLLFFSDRDDKRITHVGIALGGGRMVHLALGRGGYASDRLDQDGDPYVVTLRGRFVVARRVL